MDEQRLAYENPEFLKTPDARPIRILAEYSDPLRRFQQENIQDTVVFFGSARVHSRERAERALRMLQAKARPEGRDDHAELASAAARPWSGRATTRRRASWRTC